MSEKCARASKIHRWGQEINMKFSKTSALNDDEVHARYASYNANVGMFSTAGVSRKRETRTPMLLKLIRKTALAADFHLQI
jgi:hypothetical protein